MAIIGCLQNWHKLINTVCRWRAGFAVFFLLTVHAAYADWHSRVEPIMGTEVAVTFWHENPETAALALDAVMAEMERINQLLSPYLPASELSLVNKQAYKKAWPVSQELFNIVSHANWVSNISEGAFDITFASVGFSYNYREKRQPNADQIKQLLPAINYRLIELDVSKRTIRFKHPDVRIDLGGIAKGYAVDNSIAILKGFNIEHASVSAGGDSYLLGDHAGRPWVIGIKHPRAKDKSVPAVIRLPLSDTAVSTSGDYERFFLDANTGERVHHIVNPKTGRSASDVMSVTILAPTSAQADPLSTTVFVLGVKKGLELVKGLQGVDAIIIDKNAKVFYSEGLAPPQS